MYPVGYSIDLPSGISLRSGYHNLAYELESMNYESLVSKDERMKTVVSVRVR